MTPEIQKKHDEKLNRIYTTVALKEADRVPININGNIFAVRDAGYTVAECIYDTTLQKPMDAVKRYLLKFDPDVSVGMVGYAGEGPIMELLDPTFMKWAGMPDSRIDANSEQQFIEFPILEDEEFDQFWSDRTGWIMQKSMPKISNTLKPMAQMDLPLSHRGLRQVTAAFSKPEVKKMIQTLWKAQEMYDELGVKAKNCAGEIAALGFPSLGGGKAIVPFDEYSDTLRGTLLSLTDLYECPENVERFHDEFFPGMMDKIKKMNPDGKKNGKLVHMTLHKGMDTFMSQEHYEKYYWRDLQAIIHAIVEIGMIPYVFCEGMYSSRLGFLRDVPKGKVIYAFDSTPLELVKKELGDTACFTGGFPNTVLDFGTVQETIDEVKRTLDLCAPGGGYIFRTRTSLGNSKPENVEAMFQTVRDYGKY